MCVSVRLTASSSEAGCRLDKPVAGNSLIVPFASIRGSKSVHRVVLAPCTAVFGLRTFMLASHTVVFELRKVTFGRDTVMLALHTDKLALGTDLITHLTGGHDGAAARFAQRGAGQGMI